MTKNSPGESIDYSAYRRITEGTITNLAEKIVVIYSESISEFEMACEMYFTNDGWTCTISGSLQGVYILNDEVADGIPAIISSLPSESTVADDLNVSGDYLFCYIPQEKNFADPSFGSVLVQSSV